MAAENNPNIKINGSVRLVGEVPSILGTAPTTSMPPEMSTTVMETTTTMATTTTRKNRSTPTIQVSWMFCVPMFSGLFFFLFFFQMEIFYQNKIKNKNWYLPYFEIVIYLSSFSDALLNPLHFTHEHEEYDLVFLNHVINESCEF